MATIGQGACGRDAHNDVGRWTHGKQRYTDATIRKHMNRDNRQRQ